MTAYVLILLNYTSSHELMSAAMQEFSPQQMCEAARSGIELATRDHSEHLFAICVMR
jgi:hypothetical protein